MKSFVRHIRAQSRFMIPRLGPSLWTLFGASYAMFAWGMPYAFGQESTSLLFLLFVNFTAAVFLLMPLLLPESKAERLQHACPVLPTLPIRWWVRMLADVCLLVGLLLLVRFAFCGMFLFGEAQGWLSARIMTRYLGDSLLWGSLLGALHMLPFLLLVLSSRVETSPSCAATPRASWFQMVAWMGLMGLVYHLGWMKEVVTFVPVCLVFSVLPFPLLSLAKSLDTRLQTVSWKGELSRQAAPATRQLAKDLFAESLPYLALLVLAWGLLRWLSVQLIGDSSTLKTTLFLSTTVVFSGGVALILRPISQRICLLLLDSNARARVSTLGACSVLPMKRSSLLRVIFLYGLGSSLLGWLGFVGLQLLEASLQPGPSLPWRSGDWLFNVILPLTLWVPLLSLALVFFATRSKTGLFLVMLTLMFGIQIPLLRTVGLSLPQIAGLCLTISALFGLGVAYFLFPTEGLRTNS